MNTTLLSTTTPQRQRELEQSWAFVSCDAIILANPTTILNPRHLTVDAASGKKLWHESGWCEVLSEACAWNVSAEVRKQTSGVSPTSHPHTFHQLSEHDDIVLFKLPFVFIYFTCLYYLTTCLKGFLKVISKTNSLLHLSTDKGIVQPKTFCFHTVEVSKIQCSSRQLR